MTYIEKAKQHNSPEDALQYLAFCHQIISISKTIGGH